MKFDKLKKVTKWLDYIHISAMVILNGMLWVVVADVIPRAFKLIGRIPGWWAIGVFFGTLILTALFVFCQYLIIFLFSYLLKMNKKGVDKNV